MTTPIASGTTVRLSDVMAALSAATELSMGQPPDHALTTCVVAMRLGDALGFDNAQLHDVYYESLLRYLGCNAETTWAASIVGDEIALRTAVAAIDHGDKAAIVATLTRVTRESNAGAGEEFIAGAIARMMDSLPQWGGSFFPGHCEVARQLATRFGFPESFVSTVGQLYARWDGHGVPALAGEEIAPAFLCAALAQDAVVFHRIGGVEAAVATARARSGGAHAPKMVQVFVRHADRLLDGLDREPMWEAVQRLEPGTPRLLDDDALDTAFEVLADYGDIKSPWFLNHSHRVAALAHRAAERCGMSPATSQTIRRAALVHDIGKVGVSSGIWAKAGVLTDEEREKARRHPYYTGRIFARSEALGSIGALAALHHEALDGSGYHRGVTADLLSPAARLLAAANALQSRCDARPHRSAMSLDAAAADLERRVRDGQMDGEAVRAVLDAAGGEPAPAPATTTTLTDRERQVLTLVARGYATKQIAGELDIAYKTADRHIQNVYAKIGIHTRAAATMFAMRHRLV
jgi:HD-GYP domain-containing protein (c-di-GMP phosphodiesterase class II)